MNIIEMIQDAESIYISLRQKRLTCMAQLRAMGVAFKDIESRLFKEARREGYYSDDSQLESARKRGISWIIAIDRFIKWVNNNYKTYDTAKAKPVKKKKGDPTIERRPAKVSEEKATKLLESDDNRKAIEVALINRGAIVIEDGLLTEPIAEKILEDDNNLKVVITLLEEMGYKVE